MDTSVWAQKLRNDTRIARGCKKCIILQRLTHAVPTEVVGKIPQFLPKKSQKEGYFGELPHAMELLLLFSFKLAHFMLLMCGVGLGGAG